MITFRALVSAALLTSVAGCRETGDTSVARSSGEDATLASFHAQLSPYGRWIDYPPYGLVWTPDGVPPTWRPYADGYWVYTDFGWTWAAYEPWGWAPYHYGRWQFDPAWGWLWVPGTVWAPAWVAWRDGADWVGWAPLPPPQIAPGPGPPPIEAGNDIAPIHWSFIPRRALGSTHLARYLVSPARNVTLLTLTGDATRYGMRAGRLMNLGPEIASLERRERIEIPRLTVMEAAAPPRSRGQLVTRDVIRFYRPEAHRAPARAAAPRARRSVVRMPESMVRLHQEAQRQRLEQTLLRERSRLVSEHAEELRTRSREETIAAIRRRQDAEQQAFEAHAAELRQVLEGRFRAHDEARAREKAARPAPHPRARDQGA